MEALIAQNRAAYLSVSIENQTIALCIDARLSRDMPLYAHQEKSHPWLHYSSIQLLKLTEMSVKNEASGDYEQISILIC